MFKILIEVFSSKLGNPPGPTQPNPHESDQLDSLFPSDIFGRLKPSYRSKSLKDIKKALKFNRDFRIGPISIEWIDFDHTFDNSAAESINTIRRSNTTDSNTLSNFIVDTMANEDKPTRPTPPLLPTSGIFTPFQSGVSRLNTGILHLYREKSEISSLDLEGTRRVQISSSPLATATQASVESRSEGDINDHDGSMSVSILKSLQATTTNANTNTATSTIINTGGGGGRTKRGSELSSPPLVVSESELKGPGTVLCILAVPSYMTSQDFIQFISSDPPSPTQQTQPHHHQQQQPHQNFLKSISHIRILRDTLPNRYMALLNFRSRDSADGFYTTFLCKPFNALDESEVCQIVYVHSIQFMSRSIIPDFALPISSAGPSLHCSGADGTTEIQRVQMQQQQQQQASSIELPTCPVCLERMDSHVTGLLTILCHHTFHW
jgi:hypothetical protein